MGVDVEFELRYLISDVVGEEVSLKSFSYSSDGVLCIEAVIGGVERRACIELRQCKAISSLVKRWKCVIKTLSSSDKALEELRSQLRGGERRG